jgi:EpsI family protein
MPKSKLFATARLGLFATAALILVLQASASRMLKIDEANIGLPGLRQLPWQVGPWKASAEQELGPSDLEVLKPDEYVLRDYVDGRSGRAVDVFVAYFKSLQNTYGPHSPRICLPGSGWLVSSSKLDNIPVPGRPGGIPINHYTMEKANQRILVLYWYQNDRDVWAEEYHAKLRLLPDLIRYRRSDVSLVRLITQLEGSTADAELNHTLQFTEQLFPMLAQRFATVH